MAAVREMDTFLYGDVSEHDLRPMSWRNHVMAPVSEAYALDLIRDRLPSPWVIIRARFDPENASREGYVRALSLVDPSPNASLQDIFGAVPEVPPADPALALAPTGVKTSQTLKTLQTLPKGGSPNAAGSSALSLSHIYRSASVGPGYSGQDLRVSRRDRRRAVRRAPSLAQYHPAASQRSVDSVLPPSTAEGAVADILTSGQTSDSDSLVVEGDILSAQASVESDSDSDSLVEGEGERDGACGSIPASASTSSLTGTTTPREAALVDVERGEEREREGSEPVNLSDTQPDTHSETERERESRRGSSRGRGTESETETIHTDSLFSLTNQDGQKQPQGKELAPGSQAVYTLDDLIVDDLQDLELRTRDYPNLVKMVRLRRAAMDTYAFPSQDSKVPDGQGSVSLGQEGNVLGAAPPRVSRIEAFKVHLRTLPEIMRQCFTPELRSNIFVYFHCISKHKANIVALQTEHMEPWERREDFKRSIQPIFLANYIGASMQHVDLLFLTVAAIMAVFIVGPEAETPSEEETTERLLRLATGVMRVIKKKYGTFKGKMDRNTRLRLKKVVNPLLDRTKGLAGAHHHHQHTHSHTHAPAAPEVKAETKPKKAEKAAKKPAKKPSKKQETMPVEKPNQKKTPRKRPVASKVQTSYDCMKEGNEKDMETRKRLRSRLVGWLSDICASDPVLAGRSDVVSPEALGVSLECEMFDKFGPDVHSVEYQSFYKLLRSTLKNKSNVHMQRLLLTGVYSARRTMEFTAEDMASEEQQRERAEAMEYYMEAAIPDKHPDSEVRPNAVVDSIWTSSNLE
ncbi:hypothetical protein KIPB_003287 [Kipferlia bialata]|uniref:TFIIS central domain-containing protein n=1 Tax=Kipferlia bialata TaxID=797122 RepID=A0A9K3CU78_9EUKA|nr:hypothetical protein KIPB_003287 [Kipferlia bialata]|eukprot:g3287.t1